MQNLDKIKARLVTSQPFFASLILSMPMLEAETLPDGEPNPTIYTDGKEIRYNPSFMASLDTQEGIFVLAHEVMHCVYQHMYTENGREHLKWMMAGDYVINALLVQEQVGTMPKGHLHNPKLVEKAKGTTEGVYNLLPDLTPQQKTKGIGSAGMPQDGLGSPGGSKAEREAARSEMQVRVAQAAAAAKACGKLSTNLERLVTGLLAPRVDWRSVLRRFLNERAKIDWSYAKPKRRWLAEDIYLPSLQGEQLGDILIAVDCSGSITPDLINKFASEINSICEDARPKRVHVAYFDSQVCHYDLFEQDQPPVIKPHGGGGTAFSPIFAFAKKRGVDPAACVVLTDLECTDFGPRPEYPVLWCSIQPGSAPWGEILLIKD